MFGFGSIKLILAGIAAVFCVSIGWGLSDMLQVKPLKLEVQALNEIIGKHEDAAKKNLKAISDLMELNVSQDKLCTQRLAIRTKTNKKLADFEKLREKNNDTKQKHTMSGDPRLDALNGMSISGQNDNGHTGIEPSGSVSARETVTVSCTVAKDHSPRPGQAIELYCLDTDNLVNHLKNNELLVGYGEELRTILEALRNRE